MQKQSLKKNYLLNTAYQMLALVTPLVTAPYISRVLGADGVGTYSYTFSIVAFFSMFAMLGTSTYGQRAIAQCREDRKQRSKTFWEIELVSLTSMFICVCLWLVFVYLYPEYTLLFQILTFEILSSGLDISWFYSGLERFTYIVYRNAVIKLGSIVLLFLLVKERNDIWIYALILTGAKFLGNASMWIPLRRFVDRVRLSQLRLSVHFRETLVYFIPTITSSVYTYLDKVMIGAFTDTTVENGFYEQAQKIIRITYTVIASLNTVMFSRMSYLFGQNATAEIKRKLEKSLGFILMVGMPIVFGISAISFKFVPWFYGEEFEKVVLLLILSSPLVLILSMHNYLSSQFLIPSGQRARSTKGVFVGAGVNFVLNALLIPRYASVGAVIATLIAEGLICGVYFYMSKEYVPIRFVVKYGIKPLVASMMMAAAVYLLGENHKPGIGITLIQIALGAAIYVTLLFMLRDHFFISLVDGGMQKLKSRGKRAKD